MKLKRLCSTCYHFFHKRCQDIRCEHGAYCDYPDGKLKEWKPYSNADHIRHMDDSELADYIMRAKGAAYKLICDDCHDGCWFFDCKTNHHCNGGNGSCMVTKEDVLRWLKSEVITDN